MAIKIQSVERAFLRPIFETGMSEADRAAVLRKLAEVRRRLREKSASPVQPGSLQGG